MNFLARLFTPRAVALADNARQPLYSEQAFDRVLAYLSTVPDPDLMLQKAGIERQHLRFLELDDEVAQCVETRKDALLAVPRRLEPNQTRAAKWLMTQMEPHLETLLRGVMSAVFYGYSVLEITYRLDAGRTVIDRMDERNIEWFRIHPTLGWRYYPNDGSGGIDGLELDPRKFFITVRHSTTRNPYGESLLSRLWFPVTWRREGWQMYLKFLELFCTPKLLAQISGDPPKFVRGLKDIGFSSVVAWNGHQTDKVITINASHPGEFERLENALTKRVQKLILGQTLTSDVGDTGSYAAAKVHNEVRHDKTLADSRLATHTIQRLFDTLADLNHLPRHQFVMADDVGLESERAVRDAALVPVLQASGLKLTQNYFEDRYDYRSEDLATVETDDLGAPGQPEPATGIEPPSGAETAEARAEILTLAAPKFTQTQREIEDLGDALLDEAPANPLDPDRLRDAIMGAKDEADLRERLLVVWEKGPDKDFADTLEKAAFAARVIGYVSASEGRS